MDGWVEGIRCGNGHCSLVAKGHGLCLWLQDWILYMELHNEYLNQLDQNSWKQPSPTRSIEAVVQRDESSSVSCLVPSLLHVLITYYGLQKIIFGERISEWFSCRNRIWQHAQSAFKTDIQKKNRHRARGRCYSAAASRKLHVTIRMDLKYNMIMFTR